MDNELIEVGGRVMRRYLLKYFHTYHYKTHEDDWAEGSYFYLKAIQYLKERNPKLFKRYAQAEVGERIYTDLYTYDERIA